MAERLAFLLDGVPEAERIARCRDRLCAKIAHSQSLTQKPTSPDHRLPLTAFETHNGRSTFAAGTALHAPKRTASARLRPRCCKRAIPAIFTLMLIGGPSY